jgi:hypothetical protein
MAVKEDYKLYEKGTPLLDLISLEKHRSMKSPCPPLMIQDPVLF